MILMIYTSFSTFVKVDYEILSKNYKVKKYKYSNTKSVFSHIINQLKIFIWLLSNIYKCQAVYIWFADYHSFLPILLSKLLRKKSFLVLGGYDVTYIPEYDYGSFNNPLRAFCAKYSIRNAKINLAVSDNIREDALKYVPSANVTILYTGYSENRFTLNSNKDHKEILTICGAETLQRAYIKGADLVLEVAKHLPDLNFNIVALNEKLARENFNVPGNVNFVEELSQDDLIKYFQKASVYIQLSIREGLPNSVCEAMLCGCIPVGTNSGGIPIAIGNTDYIALSRDPHEISKLIIKATKENENKRLLARNRIINNFSLELRTKKLTEIIHLIINENENY